MNREQRRLEIRHRKKAFGGKYTAQEYHSKYAFPPDAVCTGCRTKTGLQTRIIVMAPLDEIRKRDPAVEICMQSDPESFFKMLVPIKGPDGSPRPFLRMKTVYACVSCTPAAERAAAKGPSWMLVEINKGPSAPKVVSGYTG